MSRGLRSATMRSRRGMTLLELLVAMVILLVGIWTVAMGFPKLLSTIRGEGDRTTMVRLAQREMERFSRDPEGLPDAISGGGSISPYDPIDDLTDSMRPANFQENALDVIGETFRVPAAYIEPTKSYVSQGTISHYVLRQGPAEWSDTTGGTGGMPYVYLLVPLTEQRFDPSVATGTNLADNCFYVQPANGSVVVHNTAYTYDGNNRRAWSVDELVVDYGWAEDVVAGGRPLLHYVQNETANDLTGTDPLTARVHAAHLPSTVFGQLLPGQVRVWAKHYFRVEGGAFGAASPTRPGYFALDPVYGLTLRFHPQDAGLTLKVDYRLHNENGGRRMLLMVEDLEVPALQQRVDSGGLPYGDVRFSLRNVDDGADTNTPVFATNPRGTPLSATQQSNVLVVDPRNGSIYTEGTPFSLSAPNLSPALEDGYGDGIATFPLQNTGVPADYVGRALRFYYRTLDRHNVQLMKAPRAFVDATTARAYWAASLGYLPDPNASEAASLAEVDYRTYNLTYLPAPSDNTLRIATLEFGQWLDEDDDPGTAPLWSEARNCAGMTVAVNYAYWTGTPARQEFVYGELHTIPGTASKVALNYATRADDGTTAWDDYPVTIMAVNGVSARMRAWWLNNRGQQKQADIESCFLPTALGLLPRVK